jgi:hypothetical protein
VQNADFGISRHSMDNQQKKEHLMKTGIVMPEEKFSNVEARIIQRFNG